MRFLKIDFSRKKAVKEMNSALLAGTQNQSEPQPTIINVNTASQKELERLPGVGPEIARRIIEYRQTKGSFIMVDDLKKIRGLGDKKIEKIKNLITL